VPAPAVGYLQQVGGEQREVQFSVVVVVGMSDGGVPPRMEMVSTLKSNWIVSSCCIDCSLFSVPAHP
jgi:hypothetical protein